MTPENIDHLISVIEVVVVAWAMAYLFSRT